MVCDPNDMKCPKEANPLKSITQKGNRGAEVRFTDGSVLEVDIKNNKLSAKIK